MDLPTCPGCGQSVLDDDAEVCPFCGASMSGKASKSAKAPQSRSPQKTKKSPPNPAKPAQAPSQTSPGSKTSKGSKSKSSGDLKDLGLDTVLPTDAIQASPQKTKNRRLKVVCPMCDAVGYIPTNAASKEIRCPNKKCLSPVFKAPELKRKETVNVSKKNVKKNNSKLIIAAAGGIFFLVGIIVIAIVLKKKPAEDDPKKTTPPITQNNDSEQNEVKVPDNQANKTPEKQTVPNQIIIDEIIDVLMPKYATSFDKNRSKAYCRRLSAIARAIAGQPDKAKAELKRFDTVGSSSPYEKIFPLSEIAWHYVDTGDKENALIVAKEIITLKDTIPSQGHTAIDSATTMAITLAATNQTEEAIQLVKKFNQPGLIGQSLALIRKSQMLKDYNFNRFINTRRSYDTRYPQWSTVATSLASHGLDEKAVNWSLNAPGELATQECLCALIDAYSQNTISSGKPDIVKQFQTKIGKLPTQHHATMWARASTNAIILNKKEIAKKFLEESRKAFEKRSQLKELVIPDQKTLASSQLNLNVFSLSDAITAFEIARAEHLSGNHEQAWKSIDQSLSLLKAFAPSLKETNTLLNDLNNQGQTAIQAKIKKLLDLDSNSKAAKAYSTYRKNCRGLHNRAEKRYAQSLTFLSNAISWNFESEVLEAIKNQEQYSKSDLFLQIEAQAKKNDKKLDIPKPSKDTRVQHSLDLVKLQSGLAYENGKTAEAIRLIEKRKKSERPWKTIQLLALISQIASDQKVDGYSEIKKVRDPIMREFSVRLYSSVLSSNGMAEEAWNFCKERRVRMTPTERISGLLGTIEGILASDKKKK